MGIQCVSCAQYSSQKGGQNHGIHCETREIPKGSIRTWLWLEWVSLAWVAVLWPGGRESACWCWKRALCWGGLVRLLDKSTISFPCAMAAVGKSPRAWWTNSSPWPRGYGYDVTPESWKRGEPGPTADGSLPRRYDVRYSACMFALALTEMAGRRHSSSLIPCFRTRDEGGSTEGLIVEQIRAAILSRRHGRGLHGRRGYPVPGGAHGRGTTISICPAYGIDLAHCKEAAESGRNENEPSSICRAAPPISLAKSAGRQAAIHRHFEEDVNQHLFDKSANTAQPLEEG